MASSTKTAGHEPPNLLREEVEGLLVCLRRGEPEAADRLALSFAPLVAAVAWEYRERGVPLEDLKSGGNVGLMTAIRRYDPARARDPYAGFVAYARATIHGAIKDTIAAYNGHPYHDVGVDEAVAEADAKAVRQWPRTVRAQWEILALREAMRVLDPLESQVITERFGFDWKGERTLEEIHRSTGLSREGVRCVLERAKQKVAEKFELLAPRYGGPFFRRREGMKHE